MDVTNPDLSRADGDGRSPGDKGGEEDRLSKEEVSKLLSQRINENNERWQKQVDELKQQLETKSEPKKVYSRAELNAAVESGKITEAEAQSIFDRQQQQQTEDAAKKAATETITEITQTSKIQASIDKYTAFDPGLLEEGSDSRRRIESEIRAQMGIFNQTKATLATELAALRAVYGPEDRLTTTQRKDRETHQDTNTGTDNDVEIKLNKDGSIKGMSKREKDYYQNMIDKGYYKDMKEVAEKIQKFGNQGIRKRAAARST